VENTNGMVTNCFTSDMDPFPISFTVQGAPGHPGSRWRSPALVDGLNRLVRGTVINTSPAPLTTTATITSA
jgi:hypothetical protein